MFFSQTGRWTNKKNQYLDFFKKTLRCESGLNFSLLALFSSVFLLLFYLLAVDLWPTGLNWSQDVLPTAQDLPSSIMQAPIRQGSLIFSGLLWQKQQSCGLKAPSWTLLLGVDVARTHAAICSDFITFNLGSKLLRHVYKQANGPNQVHHSGEAALWIYDAAAEAWR